MAKSSVYEVLNDNGIENCPKISIFKNGSKYRKFRFFEFSLFWPKFWLISLITYATWYKIASVIHRWTRIFIRILNILGYNNIRETGEELFRKYCCFGSFKWTPTSSHKPSRFAISGQCPMFSPISKEAH